MTRGLGLRFALLTGMAIGLVALSALIQELQAASTAWIAGQGYWSRGQQDATAALSRYLARGDAQDLDDARQALRIPLGDLQARLALEQAVPDEEKARQGFLQGGNARADIPRLVFSFRYARDLGAFREATALWRQTDGDLEAVQALVAELQRRHAAGELPVADRNRYLQQLRDLDRRLQVQAQAFSQALLRMATMVRIATLMVGGLSVLVISLMAVALARRVGKDLTEHESRFRAAFYQANVGMLKLDTDGRVVEANQAMADILDYRRDVLLQMLLGDLLMEGELVLDGVGRIDWDRQLRPSELRFRRRDGSLVWGRWSGTAVRSSGGGLSVFAIIEDVSQNHALAREIEHHASHDPLTGLINRREIERLLERALLQVRTDGGTHALCYINLDHFKLVNDSFGHAAGDQMLRGFADYLVAAVRDGDWVGRLGADEFAVFLAHAGQDEAKRVLQRVIRNLGQATSVLPALRGAGAHAWYRWQPASARSVHAGGGAIRHGGGAGSARARAVVPPPAGLPGTRAPAGPVQRQRFGAVDRRAGIPRLRLRPARAQPRAGLETVFRDHRDRGDQQPQPGTRFHRCGQGAWLPDGTG